jgi:hypothetical protein
MAIQRLTFLLDNALRPAITRDGGNVMATKTWTAKIKLKNGAIQEVTVQADSFFNAKAILESQYGKGSIWSGPLEAR